MKYWGLPDPQSAHGRAARRAWLITFTDLVSLLLAFFVLLFSMRNVETEGWQSTVDSLTRSLNPGHRMTQQPSAAAFTVETVEPERALDLDYLSRVLAETLRDDPIAKGMALSREGERLVIALPAETLFADGRSGFSEDARRALFTLGGVLRHIGNGVAIRAGIDPPAGTGEGYVSDWGGALDRARAVADVLRDSGYIRPVRLYADGPVERSASEPGVDAGRFGRGVTLVIMEDVSR